MELYYRRSFREAADKFREVVTLLPEDFNARSLFNRCAVCVKNPPRRLERGGGYAVEINNE
jgi:hypothetical protein